MLTCCPKTSINLYCRCSSNFFSARFKHLVEAVNEISNFLSQISSLKSTLEVGSMEFLVDEMRFDISDTNTGNC